MTKRDQHPYTTKLVKVGTHGEHVAKIYVRLSDGSVRFLRPKWVGKYYGAEVNAWCVQRWGCAQTLHPNDAPNDWPKWKTT